jgi:autotransporter-associated beta strand protein
MARFALALAGWCLLQSPAAAEPHAPSWSPTSILTWNPAADPDAPYNRSLVPLASRFAPPTVAQNPALNAAWNINSHARSQEGRVLPLIAFDSTPSQGTASSRFYAPTTWQYMDVLGYWAGAVASITVPPAHMVDAAHRNGVPVLGNVFLAPVAYGGNIARVNEFLTKRPDGSFPVADKMIEAALYYGFDGWFINEETAGGNTTTANNMQAFLKYCKAQAPSLHISWYDSMISNGNVSWQRRLNSSNQMFFQAGTRVSDSFFLDFYWQGGNAITSSASLAQSLGRSPYDIYAGIDTEGAGDNGTNTFGGSTPIDWLQLFPEGQPHRASLGIYRPEWTFNYSSSTDPSDSINREIRYWCGQNSDPANTSIPAGSTRPNWPGIAHFIPANSPIMAKPFVTHFNLGQGTQAAVNGVLNASGPWTNLSTQDVLPTWKWNVTSTGSKLVPAFDFADPYYGGTSLKITGDLNATNDIRLYQTSLDVTANTSLQLIHKRGTTGATAMQVGVAFEDAPSTFVYLNVGNSATNGWNTTSFPLATYAGRKIAVISLRFANASPISGYSMKIGKLAIFDGAAVVPAAPANVVVEALNSIDSNTMSLRLKWTASPDPIRQYNVYVRHLNNSRIWAGASLNNVYFLPIVRRINNEASFKIEVEAVSPTFGTSAAAVTADIVIPPPPPLTAPFITSYTPLTGATVIGTTGDWNNLGISTRDKAFDNNVSTFVNSLDANASTAWCGLDLGAGNSREARAVSFYPRSTLASRLVGGRFEGSNVADFSSGVTLLATITATPQEGAYTTLAINNPGVFRYFRYLTPGGAFCNVAEVKFYGPPNFAGTSLTWDSGNTGNGATVNPASGNWNTLAQNIPWNGGTSNHAWVNGIDANFAGADGSYTISLTEDLAADDLNFTNSGYTLSATDAKRITMNGQLNVSAGKTATVGSQVTLLRSANTAFSLAGGTLNIASGATVAKTGTNHLQITGSGTVVNVAGTLSRTGSGTGANSLRIGSATGDNATVNISTGGLVSHDSTNNRIDIGAAGEGRVNVTGGTLQAANGGAIHVGSTGIKGTLDVSGGLVTSIGDIVVGNMAEGILNVSAGTVNVTGTASQRLVVSAGGPAIVSLSGSGGIAVAGSSGVSFGFASTSSGAGVFNLNGGTLTTRKISKTATASGASAVFNFNGGLLRSSLSNTVFMSGLDLANVHDGGARIDTNGHTITIAQPLLHSSLPGAAATDGGLIKSGTGTLTLSGMNSYNGETRVQAGELALETPSLDDTSTVRIDAGAGLRLSHGISDTIGSLYLNGVRVPRGTYVPQDSVTPGIRTPYLIGTTGSLVVLTDDFPTAFDSWASSLPPEKNGRQDDADDDGFTNLQEFLFGTSPTTPTPSLNQHSQTAGELTVFWNELNHGASYQLLESADLMDSPWPVSSIVPTVPDQTGVPVNYTLKQAVIPLDGSRKFVRVRGTEN